MGKTERLANILRSQLPKVSEPGIALARRTIGAVIKEMMTVRKAIRSFQNRRMYEMAMAMKRMSMMIIPIPERKPRIPRAALNALGPPSMRLRTPMADAGRATNPLTTKEKRAPI